MAKTRIKIEGWVLIADYGEDDWQLAWMDFFTSKRRALQFAKTNGWMQPYRAVRGQMTAGDQ